MRNDLEKVLTERARWGVSYYRNLPNEYRKAKRFKLDEELEVDDEFCCRVLPMRSKQIGYDGKSSCLNYSFQKRFLQSRLGRAWDDVYSEICSVLKGSEVQSAKSLRELFTKWNLAVNTFIDEDGVIRESCGYSSDREVQEFYVHPITRKLCRAKVESYKARCRREKKERIEREKNVQRVVSRTLQFHKIGGIWFKITTSDLPNDSLSETDALGSLEIDWLYRYSQQRFAAIRRAAFKKYQVYDVLAVRKETASKKDIKDYNLM